MTPEDFRQAVSQAIDAEMEAYTFYGEVADTAADAALKNIFGQLANAEWSHQDLLHQIMLKGSRSQYVEDSHDYKAAKAPELPVLSMSHKPVDGILLAIRKKLDAMQMYTQLSQAARNPEDKHAFLELVRMEKDQKACLEDIYAKMEYPESW